ncbi:TlpA family protein disulfide reductase, partial [Singulisphaera rosea]
PDAPVTQTSARGAAPKAARVSFVSKPRAAPPGPDTGKSFCDYDSKYRRINDFRLPDLQGRPVRFKDLDADLILLDFWGTWCQPCLRSVPHLVDLQKRLGGKKFKVVGIACEKGNPQESSRHVAEEIQKLGINYPVLLSGLDGDCPVQHALHIQAFPTLILVDREGRILWQDQGATPANLARLDKLIAGVSATSEKLRRY